MCWELDVLGSVHSCFASTGNDLGIFSIRGQNFDSVYREFCLHKSLNRLKKYLKTSKFNILHIE